jgi:hypothetical protein
MSTPDTDAPPPRARAITERMKRAFSLHTPRTPRHPNGARARSVALALFALFAIACSKTYIPNTDVEDSSDNRKVVLFCEKYRHAVEDKNVAELLKMASSSYFEDGGNTKPEDDYDYSGLKEYLTQTFVKTTGIRYEIRYRRVTFTETQHVYVDYTYAAAYKVPGAKDDNAEWRHKVADNRLDLVRDGETFKIVSGM